MLLNLDISVNMLMRGLEDTVFRLHVAIRRRRRHHHQCMDIKMHHPLVLIPPTRKCFLVAKLAAP
jgi:hypothetical protein